MSEVTAYTSKEDKTYNIMLDTSIQYKHTTESTSKFMLTIGMDAGTSENRSLLVRTDRHARAADVVTAPNEFGEIPLERDIGKYVSRTACLYDNMDITIMELESAFKEKESMFKEPLRCLYGSLLEQVGISGTKPNQASKIKQKALYVNILSTVLMQSYLVSCSSPTPINHLMLDFGIVLPPMEVYSDGISTFRESLCGIFKLSLNRLNYELVVEINNENIFVDVEGCAAYPYYLTSGANAREKIELNKNKFNILYDVGAGTNNLAIIKNSKIVDDWTDTFTNAGDALLGHFSKLCARQFDGRHIERELVQQAIKTCMLSYGGEDRDVRVLVDSAKLWLSRLLYKDLMDFMQTTTIAPTAIYSIIYCGNTTRPSGSGNVIVPSVGEYVTKLFMEVNPKIKMVLLSTISNTNLLGLAINMRHFASKK